MASLFTKRKKSIDDFEVGDEVKILIQPPFVAPGIDLDEDAEVGKVESKDRKTIVVNGKKVDPAKSPVYKKGGRRTRKTRRRRQTRRKH